MDPHSLRLAPSVIDSSVFEVQEQGFSDSRRLRPSLLIQLCKRRSFIHAWLSSLRKTDGLKFSSLFWLFFLSFWTLGSSVCLCNSHALLL